MLLQNQKGYMAIGFYNLSQRRHRTDAVVKYNVEKNEFEFIYETKNKWERITGYKDNNIICLRNNYLYCIDATTQKKEKIGKIDVSEAIFEICFNKIFVWNDNEEFLYTFDMP